MTLNPATEEQGRIIAAVESHNVVVSAVAGAGKTTCILHIGLLHRFWRILLLTYNSNLRLETRHRVQALRIGNISVHTYHSYVNSDQGYPCHNDEMLEEFLQNGRFEARRYDLVILDEAQDINLLRWRLVDRIIADAGQPRMCLLGDPMQSIYQYLYDDPSDTRFMGITPEGHQDVNLLSQVYPHAAAVPWIFLTISTSFRINCHMARFINECTPLPAARRIVVPPRSDEQFPVEYHLADEVGLVRIVRGILDAGYSPQDVMLLAYSQTRNRSTAAVIRWLNRVNFYVPPSEYKMGGEKVLAHKVMCTSYHQSKGLERKVVIITDFSFNPRRPGEYTPDNLPNPYYVALTRARERLIVVHTPGHYLLPFVEPRGSHCAIYGTDPLLRAPPNGTGNYPERSFSVTRIIRYVTRREKAVLIGKLIANRHCFQWPPIQLPAISQQGRISEEVANINGIVVPAIYEFRSNGRVSLREYCANNLCYPSGYPINNLTNYYLVHNIEQLNAENPHLATVIHAAILAEAIDSGYHHRLRQIRHVDWLNMDLIEQLLPRFQELNVSPASRFEVSLSHRLPQRAVIRGRIDAIWQEGQTAVIYEFKCLSPRETPHLHNVLSDDNRLQLLIYLAIYKLGHPDLTIHGVLVNILDGHCEWLSCPQDPASFLETIVGYALRGDPPVCSDEEFLCRLGD